MAERMFVWTGGALFVTSLAVCAISYTVRWSGVVGGGWTAASMNAALLGIFAAHHSLFARDQVKRWLARRVPEPLLRSVYVWTASLLLIGTCAAWRTIGGEFYHAHGWGAWLAGAVQWLGVLMIALAVRGLDPLELAGIHPESASEGLQIGGLYGLVRHPLYLGWFLIVFGTAHMTGDRLAFAMITSAYLIIAIPWEERSLIRSFGDDYVRYRRLVRWRVLPFIY